MIVSKSKNCDGCNKRVAVKRFILWHTVKDYVTIRRDDVPGSVSYEDHTSRVDLHYCRDCWNAVLKNIPFKSDVEPY